MPLGVETEALCFDEVFASNHWRALRLEHAPRNVLKANTRGYCSFLGYWAIDAARRSFSPRHFRLRSALRPWRVPRLRGSHLRLRRRHR